jgi:hypothetical protein
MKTETAFYSETSITIYKLTGPQYMTITPAGVKTSNKARKVYSLEYTGTGVPQSVEGLTK